MDRRTLLSTLGAGLAGFAGCAGSSEPEATPPSSPSPSATASATESPTVSPTTSRPPPETDEAARSTPEAGGVRLLSVTAPTHLEIGGTARYEFTIENHRGEPQLVEPTVSTREEGSPWEVRDQWAPVELAPDERRTFEASTPVRPYLSTVELRIDGFGRTFTIEFVERQLSIGSAYQDPLGREVSLEGLTVRSVYEYSSDGYRRLVDPGDGRQWVFLEIKVVNRDADTLDAPGRRGFTLRDGHRSYQPLQLPGDGSYEPNSLPPGTASSGWIPFKTPGDRYRADFLGRWDATFQDGDVGVTWTPD